MKKSLPRYVTSPRDLTRLPSAVPISWRTLKSVNPSCFADLAASQKHSDRRASNRSVSDEDILKTRYSRTYSKFGRTTVGRRPCPRWTSHHRLLVKTLTSIAMGDGEKH